MKKKFFNTVLIAGISLVLNAQNNEPMKKFNPEIRNVEEIKMVYYTFTGAYTQSFNEFGKLIGYAQSNKLPLAEYSLGLYYDDPNIIEENLLRSEIGLMLNTPIEATEDYKFKIIPSGKAVSVRYYSMDDIYPAYKAVSDYVAKNNLKTEDFSIEIYYSNDPTVVDTEILMKIKE